MLLNPRTSQANELSVRRANDEKVSGNHEAAKEKTCESLFAVREVGNRTARLPIRERKIPSK